MNPSNCGICGAPFPSGSNKCKRCGAQFYSRDQMNSLAGGIFSEVGVPIEVPLEFWKNDNIIYASDVELYINPGSSSIKTITNTIKKYETASTCIMERREYWYLLKFFFIKSNYVEANPITKNSEVQPLLIAGIPKGLQLKCNCGKKLEDKFFLRGSFKVPEGLSTTISSHEFYLRISNPCPKCDSTMVIYRPKTGVYSSFWVFMNYLVSNQNCDLKSNLGLVVHWLAIMVDAVYKDKMTMYRLYYDDIKQFWDFVMSHSRIKPDIKESIRNSYAIGNDLKIFRQLQGFSEQEQKSFINEALELNKKNSQLEAFKSKIYVVSKFLGNGILLGLKDINLVMNNKKQYTGEENQLSLFIQLIDTSRMLFYVMCLNLFRNDPPHNINVPLRELLELVKAINELSFKSHISFFKWLLDDINMLMKEYNIEQIQKMEDSAQDFLINHNAPIKDFFMWQIGSIFATILEHEEIEKIKFKGKSAIILDDIYNKLGQWIFNDGSLDLQHSFKKLKKELKIKQPRIFREIKLFIKSLIEKYEKEIGKNGELITD